MMLSFLYPVTEEINELVPRLEMIRQNGTRLRIVGPAGVSGRLQGSTDLREWSDLQSLTFGGEPVDLSEPQTSLVTTRFYRFVTP